MRIISGLHKGRRITAPKKLPVRPTTDRSKEGLFNLLQHRIEITETEVLDLFAGTGNISYEFASRGAKSLTAVDQNRNCIQFIQKTAKELQIEISTHQKESTRFLEQSKGSFHLIFADPPYNFDQDAYENIIFLSLPKLRKEGFLILEHFKQLDFSSLNNFAFSRGYGSTVFSFFTP